MASQKTASPNPLTYAELNLQTKLSADDNFAETIERDDKYGIVDKYLFPYSPQPPEESPPPPPVSVSPTPYTLSAPSRILSSSLSHHSHASNSDGYGNVPSGYVSASAYERYGSLKRSQLRQMSQDAVSYDRYGTRAFEFLLFFNHLKATVKQTNRRVVFDRYGSLKRGASLHGSYHDNLNGSNCLERYNSQKHSVITPTMPEDFPDDFIMPISSQTLSSSLGHDLQQHSNELAALRQLQLQQQLQYEQTIDETE